MTDSFDPYHKWLGIPASQQPANFYRLFGLPELESDPDVIANAADRVMVHVKTFQVGRYSEHSQRLLNELAAARGCLETAGKKAKYDAELKEQLAPKASPAVHLPPLTGNNTGFAQSPVAASVLTSAMPDPPMITTSSPLASPLATPPKAGSRAMPAFNLQGQLLKPQPIWMIAVAAAGVFLLGSLLGALVMFPRGSETVEGADGGEDPGASPSATPTHSPSASPVDPVLSSTDREQSYVSTGSLEPPPGTQARKLVIWNQHNSDSRDRGTEKCVVHLLRGDHTVWTSDEIEVAWQPNADASTTVDLPGHRFDRLRVEITAWHGRGGGLAELQLFDGETEIARGCPARANSSLSERHRAATINDGITSSANFGFWILPNGVGGWIEIDVSRPMINRPGVIADEVVLWNTHNAHVNNSGAKVVDLRLLRNHEQVWSQNQIEFPWEEDHDHSLSIQLPTIEFDAVRVSVTEPVVHSGLGEIEILRDGENIALGCPTRTSSFHGHGTRPSRVVDGVRISNIHYTGYWLGANPGNDWIEVDVSCNGQPMGSENQQTAEYYCFGKNDWQRGVQWFARCGDSRLRNLAEYDGQVKCGNAELVSTADQWWELSQQASGLAQEKMKLHALHHYARAVPRVDSLIRERMERRLNRELQNFAEQDYLYFKPLGAKSGFFAGRRFREAVFSVDGKSYEYGIRMQPANKPKVSRLAFFINGQYKRLTGNVGINDSASDKPASQLTFRVEGDGQSLWQSEPLQRRRVTIPFQADLSGVNRLELVVEAAGPIAHGHAVWLDPRLER